MFWMKKLKCLFYECLWMNDTWTHQLNSNWRKFIFFKNEENKIFNVKTLHFHSLSLRWQNIIKRLFCMHYRKVSAELLMMISFYPNKAFFIWFDCLYVLLLRLNEILNWLDANILALIYGTCMEFPDYLKQVCPEFKASFRHSFWLWTSN